MKAERPTEINGDPGPEQAKNFGGEVSRQAPLPHKDLVQWWIDHPAMLANRLDTLQYRPARVYQSSVAPGRTSQVVIALMYEGLAVWTSILKETDLVIMGGSSPAAEAAAQECAAEGIATIVFVIEEDGDRLKSVANLFPFTGNKYDENELERFVRDVLFQIRPRLYCGRPKK